MRTAAELREAPDLLDLAGYEQGAMATTLARRRPRGEDPREARNGATKVVLHSSWCSSGEVSWRRDEVVQGRARCPGGGARRRMRGSGLRDVNDGVAALREETRERDAGRLGSGAGGARWGTRERGDRAMISLRLGLEGAAGPPGANGPVWSSWLGSGLWLVFPSLL